MSQCNLHNHTEGSLLDGFSRVDDLMTRAVECGHEFVTITDHGECNQHLKGAKAAAKAGLGFIPGTEGYWTEDIEYCKSFKKQNLAPISHITLLAQNNIGLRNLWTMSSIAYDSQHHWNKPLADSELLRTYSEGIYASDGCMMTEFADVVKAGDNNRARQILGILLDIYRERFFIELHTWQYCEPVTDEQIALNNQMRELNHAKYDFAQEMSVPFVIVNDSHHCWAHHWKHRELFWVFSTTDTYDKLALETKLDRMAPKADHIMDFNELDYWMDRHGFPTSVTEEGVRNSYEIAQSCQVQIKPTLGVPRMARSEADDLVNLIDACEQGFRRLVVDRGLDQDRYYARLEQELQLITEKRFAGYFEMVRDYTMAYRVGSWSEYVKPGAKKEPVLIGPGRGSVGGSLVGYLTGIDIIDPLRYGTMFSRFLTPERKGLPDIDVDVPQSQRKDMLSYFPKRYGPDKVCAIGTLSRNGPKGTLRDLGRAMNIPLSEVNKISEHIADVERMRDPNNPDDAELSWEDLIDRKGGELKKSKATYPQLFEKMEEMSGVIRHSGVHAAGILVADVPLMGAIPMRTRRYDQGKGKSKREVITTQLDMWDVEELGGVKLDLLGIRHLDTLSHARRLIYERHGIWIDYDRTGLSVPEGCTQVLTFEDEDFADPAIWPQIDAGQTTGIFQMETSNCTEAAVEFCPRSEIDVADLTSIIRPGVADAGLKDSYLRRRAGKEPVTYDHPLMESIVGPGWATDTFGVLVYQEQLIECVQKLAGFTPDEADDLRKNVGKKLMDKVLLLRTKFINGCLANPEFMRHWSVMDLPSAGQAGLKVASHIWGSIEASGRYAFNWSHAVGYAIVSSWEVWTKHYYPQEFLVALMATDSEHINKYIREARRRRVTILPPDVNRSERKFVIEGDAIRYGLDTVRGVGEKACDGILAARPFDSLEDFLARAGGGGKKTSAYNLVLIGAFDTIAPREEILKRMERYRAIEDLASSTKDKPERLEAVFNRRLTENPKEYVIPIPDFNDPKVVYEIEKRLVGTYVTVDPLERYVSALDSTVIREPLDMLRYKTDAKFWVGGQVATITPTVTKRGYKPGQEMAKLVIQWNGEDFGVVAFPEAWKRLKPMLAVGVPVACEVVKLDSGCRLEDVTRLDWLFDREGIV